MWLYMKLLTPGAAPYNAVMPPKRPNKLPAKPSGLGKRYSSDPKTRADELVAEGKIGGKRSGAGRRRKGVTGSQKNRALTTVVEGLRENADLMARVIPDVLRDPHATKAEKMQAARLAIRIEAAEEERRREEERGGGHDEPAHAEDREAIVAHLARALSNPIVRQRLAAALADQTPATEGLGRR